MSFTADLNEIVEKNANGLLSKHHSWVRTNLASIATILNGYPFDARAFDKTQGTPLIRIRDIRSSTTDTRFKGEIPDGYLVFEGEILVGMDGDFNTARWNGPPALLNQRVCKLTPHDEFIDRRFFFYSLGGYLQAVNANTPSITVKHLSSRTIGELPLPLPPIPEQKRIADKLDTMLARVDACRDRLDRLPALLKRFRQSILAAATSGRLTEDWRNSDVSNWTYERATDVCAKVQSGGTPKEGFSDKGIPFLKVYNIVDQKVDFDYRPQFIGSCPATWCKRQSGSHGLRSGWIAVQTATADRLTVGLSPTSASVSSVM